MKHIFQSIDRTLPDSGKHFKEFYLSNPVITESKENTFSQITFDKINIYNSTKLKLINTNAFIATNSVTKNFFVNLIEVSLPSSLRRALIEILLA